jgi:hypothetical protein
MKWRGEHGNALSFHLDFLFLDAWQTSRNKKATPLDKAAGLPKLAGWLNDSLFVMSFTVSFYYFSAC